MVPHFIGRQQSVEEISRVLTSISARLVSVSGPPGFGKTSLAIAVGHQLRQLGLPVYFLSLRSVKTAEELTSDLLNTFANASDVTGGERSKLCRLLSAIPSNICIILDNADVLFESGGETSQEVFDLLEKIFSDCKNVSFLLTTRASLQSVLGRKFAGHTSIGVVSLDRKSSQMLVQELVPAADESECCRVAEICGDVPLAIKLLCGQIVDEKKSASQFLDHFSCSSKTIVALLDDPDAPNDQRLNMLFESYFKRLSREEQEAFVCLSVFVSEVFDEQVAVNVIGGDEDTAKKTLFRLKRKYLVEGSSSEPVLFSFHPLIRSFGSEKSAGMKEIACEAERRFLIYYVQLFEDLNSQFLAGNSLLAFHDFEFNKENMVHSLSKGLQNKAVCDTLFDVLSDADLFLDTIFYFERGWMFDNIYNIAIVKAKEQRRFKAVHQLLIGKAVAEITWYSGVTLALLKEAEEIEKQNPLLISEVVMGKRMCYLELTRWFEISVLFSHIPLGNTYILLPQVQSTTAQETCAGRFYFLISENSSERKYLENIFFFPGINSKNLHASAKYFKRLQFASTCGIDQSARSERAEVDIFHDAKNDVVCIFWQVPGDRVVLKHPLKGLCRGKRRVKSVCCNAEIKTGTFIRPWEICFTTGLQDDKASKSVYATCQNSGVPWLSCKSIAKWANDEFQNSTWCQFGSAVSASYVQHVLKRFYIPCEVQVFAKYVPKPCLPPMVPHFIGRQQKVEDISRALTSTSARLVSVSGPPGFGKTSLAIAVGHQLRQLGLPVYFLSLRSVKTAEELISDLLNTFAHTSSGVPVGERSKLCGLLRAIPSNICIILDNADDLFESSGETSQDVLDLLENIFSHCENVSFLITTRMSLQSVLGRKLEDQKSVSVASLDRKSSQMLVQELVLTADKNECCKVAEVCGDVPLAIKLLCGEIVDEKKSVSQFLDNFSRSSKKLADLLDDPDAPNDQRLKVLFESYFKRISREEQEAFVCLSVFVSEVFDEQAAVNVIGGDEDSAKKTLLRLKRKYLVEGNSSEAMLFSFHPLMKSFGSEKAADMKEIAREAQRRFLSYYIKLFEELNNQFFAGNSLLAFHDFEFNKENIVHSLSEGLQNDAVCDAIFDVLSDADLFLNSVSECHNGKHFYEIYNPAIAKAKEQRKFKVIHQLLIAKAVGEITWDYGATLALLKEAEEIEKQYPLLTLEVAMGKRMCYLDQHLLQTTNVSSDLTCLKASLGGFQGFFSIRTHMHYYVEQCIRTNTGAGFLGGGPILKHRQSIKLEVLNVINTTVNSLSYWPCKVLLTDAVLKSGMSVK
ncbi:Hypothetical predicted protein, partial [Paramuricea clavata]